MILYSDALAPLNEYQPLMLLLFTGCGVTSAPVKDVPRKIAGNDNAAMVLIPSGTFVMGNHHKGGDKDEGPLHTVYLDAYYIDVHEVTNAQYARFLNEYGKNTDTAGNQLIDIDNKWQSCLIEKADGAYRPKLGYESHPVVEVSWFGAAAYAQFYGKRLPTEAEWEKAARGGLVGEKYPWGDHIDHTVANHDLEGARTWTTRDMLEHLRPVRSYPPNGYGVYDMAGNVWEWCADLYDRSYYSNSPRGNPRGADIAVLFRNDDFAKIHNRSQRVVRGGCWYYFPNSLRVADRHRFVAFTTNMFVGFRCVRDVEP